MIYNEEAKKRIVLWAGMAMQGLIDDTKLARYEDVAKYALNYAKAMEEEYQRNFPETSLYE
jgi:hypothetical protein